MKRLFLFLLCITLIFPAAYSEALLFKQCPDCGWTIRNDDKSINFSRLKFCKDCGVELVDAPQETQTPAPTVSPTPIPTATPAPAVELPPAETKIGDIITFGHYEQDGNTANGKEPIEWMVLDKKDDRILVISKYALDTIPFDAVPSHIGTNATWETCTLRQWLNNDFLNTAFSSAEKATIPTVKVAADKNPDYSTPPGNATEDKIFLLSLREANKYFSSDSARKCTPTVYAKAKGPSTNSNGFCWWWLRSPGLFRGYAAFIGYGGGINGDGYAGNYNIHTVRPAMWIDLIP